MKFGFAISGNVCITAKSCLEKKEFPFLQFLIKWTQRSKFLVVLPLRYFCVYDYM